MKVIKTVRELKQAVSELKQAGKVVGLVPTMGALHAGHMSLVDRARRENDVVVVSVFVNPTQFNNKEDLRTYPRTEEQDCRMLEAAGCDIVFMPTVEEIYPEPDNRVFDLGPVAEVMEGKFRPGHFNGVCQIVSKLFYAVTPDRAYFGEKDFQQIAVIRAMVKDLSIPVELRPCPIVRQEDGLALSSRNALLNDEERKIALNISKTLFASCEYAKSHSVAETHDFVVSTINSVEGLEVQYYEIVDGTTLQNVSDWKDSNYIVGCITVFCGHIPVRLIDNIKYKENI